MSADEDKPTPPVPPTDQTIYPNGRGSRVVEREFIETCDCGGRVFEESIETGRTIVGMWDAEDFDPDEFALEVEWEQTENRVQCERCSRGYYY